MKISGGTTFGNCAIGRPAMETRPMMTMMMDITMATMGRLMKNLDIRLLSGLRSVLRIHGLGGQRHRRIGGVHQASLPDLLNPLNHHPLPWLEALFDNPEVAGLIPHPHRLDVDFVVGV